MIQNSLNAVNIVYESLGYRLLCHASLGKDSMESSAEVELKTKD